MTIIILTPSIIICPLRKILQIRICFPHSPFEKNNRKFSIYCDRQKIQVLVQKKYKKNDTAFDHIE